MPDLTNEFAFSWSRHRVFYRCPRQLYWQYYGSWNGWREDAPDQAALAYRLKQMKNLAMLVGETFHEELSEILRRRSERAAGVPAGQLADDMERRLLKRLRESRNADWQRHADVKRYAILFEDYYQSGVSEQMQAEAIAALRTCATGLAHSGFGRRVFAVPKERLRFIDPKDVADGRVSLNGLVLYASPDLVVEDERGGLHIIDWKTGKPFKPDLAQLAIYGLFVQEKFGQPLERMTAHLVYVTAGGHETIANIAEGMEEARREIATYVADVSSRLTDAVANEAGDIARFPMTENRVLCRSCNFRQLCDRIEEPAIPQEDERALAPAGA
ncbi:MAG: hypothetical protein DLM53_08395 [Candidatus Eremiobacter antarcticus]|nr:PD-(D/E)XK nuclease family protein [Candidatus Eremiobacteraeota bacterium]MBC5809153.1 PD-(D/E)XK nuclease family protein [Candidatus Eremiobacteraeota bacterium]PZR61594.1 MAG: hypothetical protein DLM53_08395 [Candidatus Eremiobacter sp. RRmetagenome_bin22]PZR68245.1 MAG: hypothetical protein DLM63_04310 [Solirubrobacterales bacterium]